MSHSPRRAIVFLLLLAGVAACGVSLPAISRDGELRGREIELRMEARADGHHIDGRLYVAVPPEPLLALTFRPDRMVKLFADHVVGAARWPMRDAAPSRFAADRVYFAAKMFGRIFRAFGFVARSRVADRLEIHWRTDKGAHGHATAEPRGRGSVVSFASVFPKHLDLARFVSRIGAEILLRVVAFAVRARLEHLWRTNALPETSDGAETRSIVAGLAPRFPWPAGMPPAQIPAPLRHLLRP